MYLKVQIIVLVYILWFKECPLHRRQLYAQQFIKNMIKKQFLCVQGKIILKIKEIHSNFFYFSRNLNTDVPINWKIDDKILNPSIVKDQSEGRIYFNSQMHIIFKSLKFQDANIYR